MWRRKCFGRCGGIPTTASPKFAVSQIKVYATVANLLEQRMMAPPRQSLSQTTPGPIERGIRSAARQTPPSSTQPVPPPRHPTTGRGHTKPHPTKRTSRCANHTSSSPRKTSRSTKRWNGGAEQEQTTPHHPNPHHSTKPVIDLAPVFPHMLSTNTHQPYPPPRTPIPTPTPTSTAR